MRAPSRGGDAPPTRDGDDQVKEKGKALESKCFAEFKKVWQEIRRNPDGRLPQCNHKDGSYEPLQCNTLTHDCWCVDEDGDEIKFSRRGAGYDPPDCALITTESVTMSFDPKGIRYDVGGPPDRCSIARLTCGENGFCIDDGTSDVYCHCVNGYTGASCEDEPDEPFEHDLMVPRPAIPGREFPPEV